MGKKVLILLLFISVTVFSETKNISIKGFGEISVTKVNDNNYDVDFGKYGKFRAAGFLNPLKLVIQTTKEDLREFPGYALYDKMDLQEVKIEISEEGVAIEATIDTKKNFGPVLEMFKIPNPTMGISIEVSKTSFALGGELDFEENPIVLNIVPDFTRFTIENFGIGAEWAAGDGELELSFGVSLQTRWKPTEWDPDVQSVTEFSYNLMSNEISSAISMTDTWSNPILLNKLLKPNSVEFTDVAAALDWPLGAPAPSAFGFNVGHAKFFQLDFTVQLAMTPSDKQIALYAYRNEITMNDMSRILRDGFGLKVPDFFPKDIYIHDAAIRFSPNGGQVGEFNIEKGFALSGKAKFMDAIEAEVNFSANWENGFYLYYDMNAAFKDYFDNRFRNDPKLKFISGQLLHTFEVRRVMLEASADMSMNMSGKTYCDFTVLGQNVSFNIEGQFSAQALLDRIEKEIINIAGPKVAAVVGTVGKGVKKAGKIAGAAVGEGASLANKYAKLGATKAQHTHLLNGGEKYCRGNCIPNRANDLANQVQTSSRNAIQTFFDQVLDDLVAIEGETTEITMQLRREIVQAQWDELGKKIDADWNNIREDKEYVGYFVQQKWAENGGNQFRELIDQRKKQFDDERNYLFTTLLTAQLTDPYQFSTIQNRMKSTNIHIERGTVEHDDYPAGAHSTRWVFEPIKGTRFVRIKSYWKGSYLNIESGKLESSKIDPDWQSAMWELIPVNEAPDYYLIRNRWKETYLNIEHGGIECSYAEKGWLSAHWKLNEAKYPSEVSPVTEWIPNTTVLVSPNKKYKLHFQSDGNLVLSKYNTVQYWWSNTYNKNATRVKFQADGNLVVYNPSEQSLWSSGTYGKGVNRLVLLNDGNLVIYSAGNKVEWGSNTAEKMSISYNKPLHIKSAWKGTFINIENGLAVNEIGGGSWSSHWVLEPIVGTSYVRIKNRWKGTYLHIEGGLAVQCSEIEPGWASAKWEMEQIEGTDQIRIKNQWKGTYLNIESGHLQCTDIEPGWASAQWVIDDKI